MLFKHSNIIIHFFISLSLSLFYIQIHRKFFLLFPFPLEILQGGKHSPKKRKRRIMASEETYRVSIESFFYSLPIMQKSTTKKNLLFPSCYTEKWVIFFILYRMFEKDFLLLGRKKAHKFAQEVKMTVKGWIKKGSLC